MNLAKFISKQSSNPTGLFGRIVMSLFFEIGNQDLNSLVYQSLSINENDHVLEIGFGPGALLKKAADQINHGLIEGIDISEPMAAAAQKKNKKHIKTGKVKIHCGNIDTVDFQDNSFDKIYSVNTIYFWEKPDKEIAKVSRLLKPGGQLVIGIVDKADMEKMSIDQKFFKYYTKDDLSELLSLHGSLKNIEIKSKKGKKGICHCASAIK